MRGSQTSIGTRAEPDATFGLPIRPYLAEPRSVQAVVRRKTAADIARLDVVPFVEVATAVFEPFDPVTREATGSEATRILKASQNAPIDLDRTVFLGGLRRHARYRIVAQAYDSTGALISSLDGRSWTDVVVADDDRPPVPAKLPVALVDTPFSAKVDIRAGITGTAFIDHVDFSLFADTQGVAVPVPGASVRLGPSDLPRTLKIAGLQASASYTIRATAYGPGSPSTALSSTAAVLTVSDDDALASVVLSVPAGIVETLAGGGTPGLADGTGETARLRAPAGLAMAPGGVLFFADSGNHVIRKITHWGRTTTVAGSQQGFADKPGLAAEFNAPSGMAADTLGDLYVADAGNHRIRKIGSDGEVSTLAGSGERGLAEGPAATARFNDPGGVAVDTQGTVYVADTGNHRIRVIRSDGQVATLAGSSNAGSLDGTGSLAQFNRPHGLAIDPHGNLLVADSGNNRIRKVTPQGTVTTVAGQNLAGKTDGIGPAAKFFEPWGIAIDRQGNAFVTDSGGHGVRVVSSGGEVSTLAGAGAGFSDGIGIQARFDTPRGIALASNGDVYVADTNNSRLRKVGLPVPAAALVTAGEGVSFGPAPDPAAIGRVTLTAAASTLKPGDAVDLWATAFNNSGELAPVTFGWLSSASPFRGHLWNLGGGRARWIADRGSAKSGSTTITAVAPHGASASVTLAIANVAPATEAIAVTPITGGGTSTSSSVTVPLGSPIAFVLRYRDDNGSIEDPGSGFSLEWSVEGLSWSAYTGLSSAAAWQGDDLQLTASSSLTFSNPGTGSVTFKVLDGSNLPVVQTWKVEVR